MATIEVSRSHTLGKDEAKKRAEALLEKMKSSAGIKGTWAGDNFNIDAPAKGICKVTATEIRIEIDLPMLMRPMKGKIEERIVSELEKAIK